MFLKWYFGEKKTCPTLHDEHKFLAKSATDMAVAIRNGDITSTQLIQATINRIREVNGFLNAIVDGPFMEALEQAKLIDERISNKQISAGKLFIWFFIVSLNSRNNSFYIHFSLPQIRHNERISTFETTFHKVSYVKC